MESSDDGLTNGKSSDELKLLLAHDLGRGDFVSASQLLKQLGFEAGTPARDMCLAGKRVLQMDAEDFAEDVKTLKLPPTVATTLSECSWPWPAGSNVPNAMTDLSPTYALILELVNFKYAREEWTDVLALTHLFAEYLPFLAWQSTLGHAGDPARLVAPMSRVHAQLHRQSSIHDKLGANAKRVKNFRSVDDFNAYLKKTHSYIGDLLRACGDGLHGGSLAEPAQWSNPCSEALVQGLDLSTDERSALTARCRLIKRFNESEVLTMRHSSPVGHFFAVPSSKLINQRWRLFADNASGFLENTDSDSAISSRFPQGLTDLANAVRGSLGHDGKPAPPIEPSDLLDELKTGILTKVEEVYNDANLA